MGRRITTGLSAALVLGIVVGVVTASSTAADQAVPRNQSPPVIRGTASDGTILTADHGLWESRSTVAYSYQWRQCLTDGTGCSDVPRATDQVYTARSADVAHALRVAVTARTNDGVASAVSAPTVAVTALPAQAPHNTVLPVIIGSTAPGQILNVTGTWTGATPIAFSYRWRRCDAAGGACIDTSVRTQAYKLSSGDANHALRVLVTATNAAGTSSSLSDPSSMVTRPSKPANASPPTMSGTAQEGKSLTGNRGTWINSPTGYGYSWQRCNKKGNQCGGIGGAHGTTYTLTRSDVGHAIRFRVVATNAGGTAAAFSAPSTVVAPAAKPTPPRPRNTALPSIAGIPQQGQTLKADRGGWTNNPTDYDYSWTRCDKAAALCNDIGGANGPTYTLTSADVGHALRFKVTAKNNGGSTIVFSAPTAAVAIAPAPKLSPPTNIFLPTISGTPRQGQVLTGDRGNWSGAPTDYDYSWLRCNQAGNNCSGIGGAHNTTYTLTSNDVNHTIRLEVDAKNADGSTKATSSATSVVAAAPPQNASPPTTSGTPGQGQTLTGNRGNWSGSVADYDDSWLRCNKNGGNCSTIKGAAGPKYVLTAADVGKTIRFRVEAKNASGSTTATSAPTAIIASSAKAPVNKSAPTISGVAAVGQVLTTDPGKWNNSPTSYKSQWLRCDPNGGGCIAIAGAFGRTWRVLPASVGHTIRARVTASNSGGSAQATSAPTHVLGGAPGPPSRLTGCPPRPSIRQVANVAAITPPARLLVDTLRSEPRVVARGTGTLVVRFHVASTCGGPVQGALVYATATPYNQFAFPPEATTGSDGWATLVFRRLRGFPLSRRQQLLAMFVRARKPGGSLLGGISTRRLVSVPVGLG